MAQAQLAPGKRHRLEVYFRIGQRMRMGPLLMGLLGLILLAYTFLPQIITLMPTIITILPPTIVDILWLGPARRPLVVALIILSAVLYMVNIFISRASFVQARPEHFYVRAGLVPLVISYARVRSLRPVQVGQQYPPKSLKDRELGLMEPLLGMTAVAVELKSFPTSETTLRRLWSKFMFAADKKGVMLVVKDALGLIQEIDGHRERYLDRKAGRDKGPQDVFDRAAAQRRR